MPKMVRELIDFYFEQRCQPILETYITKKDYKEGNAHKLDYDVFNNYVKTQIQKEAVNEQEFKIEERLHKLETGLKA